MSRDQLINSNVRRSNGQYQPYADDHSRGYGSVQPMRGIDYDDNIIKGSELLAEIHETPPDSMNDSTRHLKKNMIGFQQKANKVNNMTKSRDRTTN